MKILNIVNTLAPSATNSWLLKVCEIAAEVHPDWQWTFYCIDRSGGLLDERARTLGAEVVHSPYRIGHKIAFLRSLRKFLQHNPHDVLHMHHDFLSAVYLWASVGGSFRKRIVHIHNCEEEIPTSSHWKALLLKEPMRQSCLYLADHIIGVSQHSLSKFLGGRPPRSSRHNVLSCGIDLQPFNRGILTREAFRRDLELSTDSKIMLFVGRMVPLKNPAFVLDVIEALEAIDDSVVACFVGTGVLLEGLGKIVNQRGLSPRVKILGWRGDTAQIMMVSDILLFPNLESPKEALGLVLVEAQAAGLPMLLSLGATEEAVVIPELANILPLAAGPTEWARCVKDILARPKPAREECLRRVENSKFSLENSVRALMELYQS